MRILVVAILLALAACDEPAPERPSFEGHGWTMVEKGPEGSTYDGIYKRRCEAEKVTFYAMKVHYGWSVTAVRD